MLLHRQETQILRAQEIHVQRVGMQENQVTNILKKNDIHEKSHLKIKNLMRI